MKKKFKFTLKIIPVRFFEIILYVCGPCFFLLLPLHFISLATNNPLITMITDIVGKMFVTLSFMFTFGMFFKKDDDSGKLYWIDKDKLMPPDEYDIEFKNITSAKRKINEVSKQNGYLLISNDIKTDKYEVNILKKETFACYNMIIVVYAHELKAGIFSELHEKVEDYLDKIYKHMVSIQCITIFCVEKNSIFLKSTLSNYNGPEYREINAYLEIDIKNKKLYLCKNNFNAYLYKKIKKELDKEKNNDN